ncbi:MAG TPA: hypothetical protein VLA90_11795 [Actinomycetota bacterium]|nr:hypothetical protein [Actinomycetota bacterium]
MTTSPPTTPRLRGVPTFGFATAGLLIGHALSYLIAVPDPHHRDLLLHATGHAYLPVAAQAAIILALAAAAAVVARSWSGRGITPQDRFGRLAWTLAVVQITAFVGQEVLERVLTGMPLGDLVHDLVLPIGIGVQAAVALVGAALLRLLARTSARAVQGLAPRSVPPPRPAFAVAIAAAERPTVAAALRLPNVRAPPSL